MIISQVDSASKSNLRHLLGFTFCKIKSDAGGPEKQISTVRKCWKKGFYNQSLDSSEITGGFETLMVNE